MEARLADQIGSPPSATNSVEETMLQEDRVRELLARLARGEGVKRVAREVGVDRNTVKRWRRLGAWRPPQPAAQPEA
ncbi:MAG: helix-turn-helix domain-containing protein [Nitrospiraceae bacterium]